MRKSFGRRLRDLVEQQQVQQQALEQLQDHSMGQEGTRELKQLVEQAQMRQVLQRLMRACDDFVPGEMVREDELPNLLGAVCTLLQELPLSLAHQSIEELLGLVVAEAIKLEEQQIVQLRRAVDASQVHQAQEEQVQQLHHRIAQCSVASSETHQNAACGTVIEPTAEVTAEAATREAMRELQQELQPLQQQLDEMRKSEMAEQAAVGRNLAEFNKLHTFCGDEQDKQVHGRVQQKIVEIGSQKWRAARVVQAPTEAKIKELRQREAVLQSELDRTHQQREQRVLIVDSLQQQLQGVQLDTGLSATVAYREAARVEDVQQKAQRLQIVVKALQGTQQQLRQVWGVVWGKQ
jgi:hypothetical protein